MTYQASDLMTVEEVAAFFRIGEATVARWARDGEIAGHKVGKTWRFWRKDVEAMVGVQP